MSKKIVLTLVLTLVFALVGGGVAVAYAAEAQADQTAANTWAPTADDPAPDKKVHAALGQLTALGEDSFTLKVRAKEVTVLVDENTTFETLEGEAITFANLQVGRWVAGRARQTEAGLVALRVVLLPEGFDPAEWFKVGGTVLTVDASANTLTIQTPSKENKTFAVDANTRYAGQVASLAEIQPGMRAGITGLKSEGTPLAKVIIAGNPPVRKAGEVTAVDTAASAFTLQTRQGEAVTIHVDENTRFRSRDGKITKLADLQPGMVALAIGQAQADGSLLARSVAANEKPNFDIKAAGQVTAVDATGAQTFTIKNREGQETTFKVTGETVFRDRRGVVKTLADLQVGMRVRVGAKETGGEPHAQVVGIIRK
jgi:hypothetical protein